MSLDQAATEFAQMPNAKTASALVREALTYWEDAMIADDTLAIYLKQVAEWLMTE